ncbi:MAG: TAG lipase/steryl ester hydrolase/phospholipase A2/LPA acyltransferase [Halieaceae bacterium]|jgi:TAG lipase/steryl ester hydrolase/phospholipase A2/LPA acyltransferase
MDAAASYSQWRDLAREHDKASGAADWQLIDQSNRYDNAQIRKRLDTLRYHRKHGDNQGLLFTLNEGLHGNMGGMGRDKLYEVAKVGTKQLIHDYVDEIANALEHIASLDQREVSHEQKLDFFQRASHCYGRTALMLSGGGALGHFHVGVTKSLLEQGLLPQVISGSSAGSVITALMGSLSDEELREMTQPARLLEEAKEEVSWVDRLLFGGSGQIDVAGMEQMISRLIPDLTFQEAYERTGRHINISVAPAELHQTSRLLNAIASPNVYIRTAVMASCAVPGVYPPVMLEAQNVQGKRQPYLPTRRWVDGSVSDDLPAKRLSRLYGVNHYIGSLINPIIMFAGDNPQSVLPLPGSLRTAGHWGAARLARFSTTITQRYTRQWPRFNLLINMVTSILNQKYTADISIYPDFRKFDMRKILSHLSEEELVNLVNQGVRATWPQLERIRISTKISQTLDRIMAEYGEQPLLHNVRKQSAHKKTTKLSTRKKAS